MYIFHWWGDVWQIGDGEDYLIMVLVKLTLASIVLVIGLSLLGFWLLFKLLQLCVRAPKIGIPLTIGLIALLAILVNVTSKPNSPATASQGQASSMNGSADGNYTASALSTDTASTGPTGWVYPTDRITTSNRTLQLEARVNIADEGVPSDVQFHANVEGSWNGLADILWKGTVVNPEPGIYTYDWDVCQSGVRQGDNVTLELQVKHGEDHVDKYWVSFTSDYSC